MSEQNRNWDEDYRDGENEYECICSICGKHFMGHKRRPFCKICASNPQSAPETIEFWRHRALTAESAFEGAMRMLGAENPPLFMGEPVSRKSQAQQHQDDIAVNRFAEAMKAKLARKRKQGRGGWSNKEDCSKEYLQGLLIGHVAKGDPVDVGNFAMMLFNRGERTQFPIETHKETNVIFGSAIQKLGARLANLLDEDQFKECEQHLIYIAASLPPTSEVN